MKNKYEQVSLISKEVLQDFGRFCYWYGEDTGDYDMKYIDEILRDFLLQYKDEE